MSKIKKINTTDHNQEVHHPITGESLGTIVSRVYDGENVQRHTFLAGEKEYSLGPTSEAFTFFDWPQVFQPVLNEGFQLEKLTVSRGGLRMHAVLSDPKGPVYKDPVNWDKAAWGKSTGLKDSIVIQGGIRPGSGFHFQRGFFRMICTNGLTVETLGLGKAHFNHINFDPDELASALFGKKTIIGNDTIYGESVGSKKGLQKTQEILQRVLSDPENTQGMPSFVRDLVSPIVELPSKFHTEAFQQFEMLIQNSPRKEVYELDIANALTSAQNKLEKAPARLAFKLLPAQRSLAKLTSIYSL